MKRLVVFMFILCLLIGMVLVEATSFDDAWNSNNDKEN